MIWVQASHAACGMQHWFAFTAPLSNFEESATLAEDPWFQSKSADPLPGPNLAAIVAWIPLDSSSVGSSWELTIFVQRKVRAWAIRFVWLCLWLITRFLIAFGTADRSLKAEPERGGMPPLSMKSDRDKQITHRKVYVRVIPRAKVHRSKEAVCRTLLKHCPHELELRT